MITYILSLQLSNIVGGKGAQFSRFSCSLCLLLVVKYCKVESLFECTTRVSSKACMIHPCVSVLNPAPCCQIVE